MLKNFGLGKLQRLKKTVEFQTTYTQGRSFAGRYIVLYVLKRAEPGKKVGIAAGKRLGKAHIRNRVKRLLREAYRLNQDKFAAGCDYLLVGRKPAVAAKRQDVEHSLLLLAGRAGILFENEK